MAERAENLRINENLMVYDLFKIFENETKQIYTDHSHMNILGNEIMAQNILKILLSNNLVIKKN